MKSLKGKISRTLALYIILFSSVVTLTLTATQLWLDYNKGIDSLEKRIEQIEITNTASITQSMWTIDNTAIKAQLDGLTRINDIIFVQIHNEENSLVASSGSINTDNIISRDIHLYKDYRNQQTYLGTLNVVATKENLYSYLIDTTVVILISQGIKTFLVTLFILLIFHYLVTRHLVKISKHLETIDLRHKPVPLKLDRKEHKKADELSLVVDSINSMSNSIYENYNNILIKQQSLIEREARFSAIFDTISDAVVFADMQRNITQVNPAFCTLFGYNIAELKNHDTSILYANPEDFSTQGKQRYNTHTNGLSLFETTYKRKDGSNFPSETMGGPIKLSDNTQIGYIAIIRDIADRKQAEDENALLQLQLRQAYKMEAIGQLTGGIAHDFNNILSSVLGYSELASHHLLQEQKQDDKLQKYINNIYQAGDRARELVAQLLAFSRSTPNEPVPLKLQTLIDDVISILSPILPSSIDLIKHIDQGTPRVLIDENQMHQILMNLCINARDAMSGHGQLSISLSMCSIEDAVCASCQEHVHGNYVKLSIEDTGTGIQPEILQRIFDPFLTTKDMGKGTGMGLSVVHGILHGHQAHILVDTLVGKGSRFDLLIPPILNDKTQLAIEKTEIDLVSINGSGKHILIVDDEIAVTDFLKDFLQTHQFTVTASTDSEQALQLFNKNSSLYDLVITDQTMPQMTGIQLAENMLKLRADIPVILCSGYSEHANEEIALNAGCAKYLSKPVGNHHLLKVIYQILKLEKK